MTTPNPTPGAQPPAPEDQKQRWLKYGGNVVLSSVVVVLIACAVTALAERRPKRIDTTATGLYSLKPQTVKLLGNLKSPVRIVSLYSRSKPPQGNDPLAAPEEQAGTIPPEEAAQTVDDLLDEYASKSPNVKVESIDPVTSPAKVDALIEQVEAKYGGQVAQYKKFVDDFKGTMQAFGKIADPQAKQAETLSDALSEVKTRGQYITVALAISSVRDIPRQLKDLQDALAKPLKQRPPDYKGAADAIKQSMGDTAAILDKVTADFAKYKDDKDVPPVIAGYMRDSLPDYQQLKKLADDTVDKGKALGELKLDTLREALRERNTILVMGDKEWRTLRFNQVWRPGPKGLKVLLNGENDRPRFAGEQQVTGAVLAVTSTGPRPKIAFIRAGGPPVVTSSGFGADAPFSDIADRLALYNFQVLEKDVTGQYAMQSQGMGPPEPTDDELKDAVWVALDWSSGQPNPMTGQPGSTIAPQLAEHLRQGGSALILARPNGDALTDALAPFGIEVRPDATICHAKDAAAPADADIFDKIASLPFAFVVHDFGDHPIAKPLRSLDGLLIDAVPVKTSSPAGYAVAPLLPVPTAAPGAWGETDTASLEAFLQNQGDWPTNDPKADVQAPLFAGAASEKQGGGARVVVLGSLDLIGNQILEAPDKQTRDTAVHAARYPANGELFMNSVFWLTKQDAMIDISPAAMEVSRIRDISPAALRFWRVGVLVVGLPLLVVIAGTLVYLRRMD